MTITREQLQRSLVAEASVILGSDYLGDLIIPPELIETLMTQFTKDDVETLPETFLNNPDFCLYLYKIDHRSLEKLNNGQMTGLFKKFSDEPSLSFKFASNAQKNDVDLVFEIYKAQTSAMQYASGDVVMALLRPPRREEIKTAHFSREQKKEFATRTAEESENHTKREINAVIGIRYAAGWAAERAVTSACNRYKELSGDQRALPFQQLEKIEHGALFKNIIDSGEHGSYQGIQAGWSQHAFTLHAIKEGELTHFIYVNRGEKHESAEGINGTVHVFSCNPAEATVFVEKLERAFRTQKRDIISDFLASEIKSSLYNKTLSESLTKSNQKVGNCTVANANITWHFNLAVQAMKETPGLSFIDAYEKTKEQYKELRINDRCRSFCNFMQARIDYLPDRFTEVLGIIMAKLYAKDKAEPERCVVEKAVFALSKRAPELLSVLSQEIQTAMQNPPKNITPEKFGMIAEKWEQAITKVTLGQSQSVGVKTANILPAIFYQSKDTLTDKPTDDGPKTNFRP